MPSGARRSCRPRHRAHPARRSSATPPATGRCPPRSTSTRRRPATFAPCPRAARAWRPQVGDLVSAQPERGLPVVAGVLLVSSAETGELLALSIARRSPRFAPAPRRRSRPRRWRRDDARIGRVIGCGVNGAWAARCLAAAGYGPGVCADPRPEAADALAAELGWRRAPRGGGRPGRRRDRDPGRGPVIPPPTCAPASTWPCSAPTRTARPRSSSRRWPLPAVLRRVGAGLGGRRALGRGRRRGGRPRRGHRARRRALGGRRAAASADEITLFDSTGLAIQDLGIAAGVLDAWREGSVEAPTISV